MIIQLGEYHDLSFNSYVYDDIPHEDWLVVVAYGHDAKVTRSDKKDVRPFSDETGYTNLARACFYLKPFGDYAADPFPEDEPAEGGDTRDFVFYARYRLDDDDEIERSAVIKLSALCSDPIMWSVTVAIGGVTFDAGELQHIDREVGSESLASWFKTAGGRPQRSYEDVPTRDQN